MKRSDFLRAFKGRDLNAEIDRARLKWKDIQVFTFWDFLEWAADRPLLNTVPLKKELDPKLVKRLEMIPLIMVDPIWLAATGTTGVDVITAFEDQRFYFYKHIYSRIGEGGPVSFPSYEKAKFLVEMYERQNPNYSPICLCKMREWVYINGDNDARALMYVISMDNAFYNEYRDVDVTKISARRITEVNGIGKSAAAKFEELKNRFLICAKL